MLISGGVFGLPQGSQQISIPLVNSTAGYGSFLTRASTVSTAPTEVSYSTHARFVLLIPPATNNLNYRLAGSTSDTGVWLSSINPTLLSVRPGTSSIFLYTTLTTAVENIRVVTF